jgi:hypothetical protein
MSNQRLADQIECFRIGALVATSAQSSADSLINGDKKHAKEDLLGMKDVLDESCIGKDFCDNLKGHIDDAVTALDSGKTKEAEEAIGDIIAISINNRPNTLKASEPEEPEPPAEPEPEPEPDDSAK